ncbi:MULTISPECIES: GntR family transcriptional regulator [Paraburkholderia]|uniref:GntR family transcriptional regulator n=1 Tax=Paraburkholderia podalyriae TaxID=1938811 RepID=A0ABR7PZ66_9BURK|nr:GntR family transcriptional regulator [Paraburkholderia podalyriae]MBC8751585.1 GntR family transcriptional regulator [Paraburkholderia podalyriae]
MSRWIPDLSAHGGPAYLAIADEIETAIRVGGFKAGDRLPSQRMLADFLGLRLNTVNRAMRETARRGLTTGSARRGTIIRGSSLHEAHRSRFPEAA